MEWMLLEDVDISESNRATVDAYSQIENLDKLYDRAKSWKVNTANIEYPTKKTNSLITVVGFSIWEHATW